MRTALVLEDVRACQECLGSVAGDEKAAKRRSESRLVVSRGSGGSSERLLHCQQRRACLLRLGGKPERRGLRRALFKGQRARLDEKIASKGADVGPEYGKCALGREVNTVLCKKSLGCTRFVHDANVRAVSQLVLRSLLARNEKIVLTPIQRSPVKAHGQCLRRKLQARADVSVKELKHGVKRGRRR